MKQRQCALVPVMAAVESTTLSIRNFTCTGKKFHPRPSFNTEQRFDATRDSTISNSLQIQVGQEFRSELPLLLIVEYVRNQFIPTSPSNIPPRFVATTMPHRLGSPTPSVNEYDISNVLFENDNILDTSRESPEGYVESQDVGNDTLDIMGELMEDDDEDEAIIAASQAASNRKASNIKGRSVKKGGGFQAMGLNANLLKAITRKGFAVPTPIQRKTIPLLLQDKDVVGMARTGSGKTAAFVIPLIEKLKTHSSKVGARALVMSPSRELALQTLQVVKELGRGTDLQCVLLVGGDSLEEQFRAMTGNPDIVIATPGRFLHLKVEMGLDLSSMRYVVFDEADRLFEMGFAAQLTEILHALPASRQTLLFSATLPKSLVEFARAGLQDPVLIRLDAESKMSPDLQSAFFTIKSSEKEGALLHLLQNVIQVPPQESEAEKDVESGKPSKKRKRDESASSSRATPSPYSTIVFAATKHHVEYIAQLLRLAGFAVSYVYGSLDQTARKIQVQKFRSGTSNVLVVTDVAARGIDIPVLANVINYDFPSQPKIFVHRVGRTARAGQKGWSYSLITDADAPYLLDLQLFLGKRLLVGRKKKENISFSEDVVVGGLSRDQLASTSEWVNKNLDDDVDLAALRSVAMKGEKLYQRTRNSASSESAKRIKTIVSADSWNELHPLFNSEDDNVEAQREKMLAIVGGFRPQESIFEIGGRRGGKKGNDDTMDVMKKVRRTLDQKKKSYRSTTRADDLQLEDKTADAAEEEDENEMKDLPDNISMASDSEIEVTFSQAQPGKDKKSKQSSDPNSFRDPENFMSYTPLNTNLEEDRAYGVHSGSNTNTNFTSAARGAQMDLGMDESSKSFGESRSIMRWDKRHKKYVARQNDEDGSKGTRLVRGESGAKIASSFRSGRFDAWKRANKIRLPKIGENETKTCSSAGGPLPLSATAAAPSTGKKYRHNSTKPPKQPDKYREDYDIRRKRVREAQEKTTATATAMGRKVKNEIRSVDDIRKQRTLKDKRREKNARPSKKGR